MRHIAMIVLGALAIGLGACAHHEEPTYTSTTQTTATSGYRK